LVNSGNLQESIPLFQKSASLNYPPSFLLLYFHTENENEEQNWKLKVASNFSWYQSKAQDGKSDSLSNLGFCFRYGIGTDINLEKAAELYRKAAEQGFASAQYLLGVCYQNGEGVPRDTRKAIELYIKAAQQGLAIAQHLDFYNEDIDVQALKDALKADNLIKSLELHSL
jgi:TPR repeat protein